MRLTASADEQGFDWDGLLMLVLSCLVILGTAGLSWLWLVHRTRQTANGASRHYPGDIPIIVFGKQLRKNLPDDDYQARLNRILHTDFRSETPSIFLLGGLTPPNTLSEAKAGQHYLLAKSPGLAKHLILEEASRNTLENLKQARLCLRQRQQPLEAALLSNRYHLHRCRLLAEGLGFSTQLLAAEDPGTDRFNGYKIFIEAFFSHWYHTGARLSRWLKIQRMLTKIH